MASAGGVFCADISRRAAAFNYAAQSRQEAGTDRDGKRQYATDVVADEISFNGPRRQQDGYQATAAA